MFIFKGFEIIYKIENKNLYFVDLYMCELDKKGRKVVKKIVSQESIICIGSVIILNIDTDPKFMRSRSGRIYL